MPKHTSPSTAAMPMTFGTLSLNFWSSTKQRMPMAMPGRLMPPASVM